MTGDAVDAILEQWAHVQPDLDVSPMAVVGRISRLSRLIDRRLAENFARHGIEAWMYDVLATLRRNGEPYEMTPGELVEQTMVTTGAMTNRIDRLVERGLVERDSDSEDRRKVVVRLAPAGRDIVEAVAPDHYALEEELLSSLRPEARRRLVASLRKVLLDLGDRPPD